MLKRMQTNPERYPSGMAYLGEYLHKNDLKFGLYSDAGYKTCGGMAASLGYEAIDLDQGPSINYVYFILKPCMLFHPFMVSKKSS